MICEEHLQAFADHGRSLEHATNVEVVKTTISVSDALMTQKLRYACSIAIRSLISRRYDDVRWDISCNVVRYPASDF